MAGFSRSWSLVNTVSIWQMRLLELRVHVLTAEFLHWVVHPSWLLISYVQQTSVQKRSLSETEADVVPARTIAAEKIKVESFMMKGGLDSGIDTRGLVGVGCVQVKL